MLGLVLGDGIDLGCAFVGPPGQVAAIAGKKEGMKQGALNGILKELGYTEEQVSMVFFSSACSVLTSSVCRCSNSREGPLRMYALTEGRIAAHPILS